MKICVFGQGAVGGILGGILSLQGHTVYFEPREKGARGTKGAGRTLRLILPDGWRVASPASERPDSVDLLLVALGRHHLHLLKKDAFQDFSRCPVVLANADQGEPDRLGLLKDRTAFLLTLMEAVSLQEGEAELVSARPVLLMEKGSAFAPLAAEMATFGVEHRLVEDLVPSMNSFFVYQLLSLPTALCNTTLAHFLSFPEGRDLARRLLAEGLRLQERSGRKTARLPVMDPRELMERLDRGKGGFDEGRRLPGRAYSPMLQDMLRNRPTEAREITKRAVEAAASVGMELPFNWKLYQKAGRAATLGWFDSPRELVASLA